MLEKKIKPQWLFYFFDLVIVIVVGVWLLTKQPVPVSPLPSDLAMTEPSPIPSPSPSPFSTYLAPKLPIKNSYAVFLVGDSMTVALGPHPSRLSQRLNDAFPDASFIVDNYAVGSMNILSLEDLLTKDVVLDGRPEPAALNRDFDILVIESFANNPMSDLPLEVGLQQQRERMDLTVARLLREKPQSVIILLATVAPSNKYGLGSVFLQPALRVNYAEERRAYLENFIKYALEKNFPLVNAYDATKLPNGDAKPGFISTDGYIHPSQQGVDFIQDVIADLIIGQRIITQ